MRRLVLFPGALGDLCMLASVLAVRAARDERIVLCVRRALAPAVGMLLPAAEIGPPMDGAAMGALFGATVDAELEQYLRAADRVDAWLARSDHDGSLSRRLAALEVPFALHEVPRTDALHHASLDYAEALGVAPLGAGAPAVAPVPSGPLPWRRAGARRLVLHPGAGAPGKVWELEGFRRVAAAWEAAGGEVVVLLGPAEDPQAWAWRAAGRSCVRNATLGDAAALIASAPYWLGNDSGMSHLAGALDRAGVVVFTATRAARWRPLGGRLAAIDAAGRALDVVVRQVRADLEAVAAS